VGGLIQTAGGNGTGRRVLSQSVRGFSDKRHGKYFKKHAKSDRIDARVLAKLPPVDAEKLHCLELGSAQTLACQRACKQLERLMKQRTACQKRLIALDRFAWPGLEETVFADLFCPAALWFREHWYDPLRVLRAGAEAIHREWLSSGLDSADSCEWTRSLVQLSEQTLAIYGEDCAYLDYELLQAEAIREQAYLAFVDEMHHRLQLKTVRPLYRQLHPSRNLETIPHVGQDGATVYLSFIGNPKRFKAYGSCAAGAVWCPTANKVQRDRPPASRSLCICDKSRNPIFAP
jgi:hypothetical protein